MAWSTPLRHLEVVFGYAGLLISFRLFNEIFSFHGLAVYRLLHLYFCVV